MRYIGFVLLFCSLAVGQSQYPHTKGVDSYRELKKANDKWVTRAILVCFPTKATLLSKDVFNWDFEGADYKSSDFFFLIGKVQMNGKTTYWYSDYSDGVQLNFIGTYGKNELTVTASDVLDVRAKIENDHHDMMERDYTIQKATGRYSMLHKPATHKTYTENGRCIAPS